MLLVSIQIMVSQLMGKGKGSSVDSMLVGAGVDPRFYGHQLIGG